MNSRYKLDSFEVSFSLTGEELLIEAENLSSLTLFKKLINDDLAKKLGDSLDVSIIYYLFKEFFENKANNVNLSMNHDGQLSCSCELNLDGSSTQKIHFTIQLEKKELDPISRFEKLVEKLSLRVTELEKVADHANSDIGNAENTIKTSIDQFGDFDKSFIEKIEKLEKAIFKAEELERKVAMIEKGIGMMVQANEQDENLERLPEKSEK